MTEVIGWLSSFVIVLTIGEQVHKQWASGSSEGVSPWLFVGQITASTGFTLYSVLVRNWMFVVTNALLLVSAILGGLIVLKHRRSQRRRAGQHMGPRREEGLRRNFTPPASSRSRTGWRQSGAGSDQMSGRGC